MEPERSQLHGAKGRVPSRWLQYGVSWMLGLATKRHCSGYHFLPGSSWQKQSYLEVSKCSVSAPKRPAVQELLSSFWDSRL